MNTDKDKIKKLIEYLEAMKRRPLLYVARINIETISTFADAQSLENFLPGIYLSFHIFNVFEDIDGRYDVAFVYEKVCKKHGYKVPPAFGRIGLIREMKKRDKTEEEIIDELLSVEIDVWKSMMRKRKTA